MDIIEIQEYDKANHAYVQNFLNQSETCSDDATGSMMVIMAQFISNVKRKLARLGIQQNGLVSREQLIGTQIDELRQCIVDLQVHLNQEVSKETLQ